MEARGADTVSEAEVKPTTPLRWRETTFTWNQAATTTMVGVGRDNIGSEGEFYGWDFTFRPNFYIVDLPKDKVRAFAEIGWRTELTDSAAPGWSGSTTDRNETLFKDMQLGLGYTRTLFESGGSDAKEYVTTGSLTGRFVLPTSEASSNQGRYLSTSLALGAKQKIKILGTNAAGLNNVTVGVTGSWGHLFARSYEPTNADIDVPRQNASGSTFESDVLGGATFDPNRLIASLTVDLPLYQDLSLSTNFRIVGRFKHDFEAGGGSDAGCDVAIANDSCVQASRLDDRNLYQPLTTFDVSLSYPIYQVVDLTLGYANETFWIGEDGNRRNIFYSPDAQFYLDIVANLDVIYTKVADAAGGKKAKAARATSRPALMAGRGSR